MTYDIDDYYDDVLRRIEDRHKRMLDDQQNIEQECMDIDDED